MKTLIKALFAVALLVSAPAMAEPIIGKDAPAFTAKDSKGNDVKLEDYKGKIVVLEWTNHECPFVVKHYDSGNMQSTQAKALEHGAVWLTVISSAEGKQGHVDGAKADALTADRKAVPSAVLLDAKGEVGRLYAAKTTPHMFVIDDKGVLAYAGAIDSIPSVDQADIAKADNYVLKAIKALKDGKPVEVSSSKSYGCGIKYE